MQYSEHFNYDSEKLAEFYGISSSAVEDLFDLFMDWRERYQEEQSPNTYEENFLIILSFVATSGNFLEIGLDRGVTHRQMVDVRNRLNMGDRVIYGVDINKPIFKQEDVVGCKMLWETDSTDLMDHLSINDNLTSVFIDGDHSYEGCSWDICTVWHLIRDGGFISFHDTGKNGDKGVKKALNRWRIKNRFEYVEADYKHGVVVIKVDKSKFSEADAAKLLGEIADEN